jgi:predicted O-linked N-acetylglucosamine transferase (SPINDLY family)
LENENKQKIIKRFNNKNITHKIHFVSGMNHNNYINLMNIADVILDPFPFGGCNSSLEGFSLGKVIVTQSSNMINGRFTTGFYKKMKLDELICKDKKEYINLAIKLGLNKKFRNKYENIIKERNNCLFNDNESIDEWKNNIINLLNK